MHWVGIELLAKRPQVTIGRLMIAVALVAILLAVPGREAAMVACIYISVALVWASTSFVLWFIASDPMHPSAGGKLAVMAIASLVLDVAAWISIKIILGPSPLGERDDPVGVVAAMLAAATAGMIGFDLAIATMLRRSGPDQIGWKVLPLFVIATAWPFCLVVGYKLFFAGAWAYDCLRAWRG
jgi:hypothetical protein